MSTTEPTEGPTTFVVSRAGHYGMPTIETAQRRCDELDEREPHFAPHRVDALVPASPTGSEAIPAVSLAECERRREAAVLAERARWQQALQAEQARWRQSTVEGAFVWNALANVKDSVAGAAIESGDRHAEPISLEEPS